MNNLRSRFVPQTEQVQVRQEAAGVYGYYGDRTLNEPSL